MKDNVGINVLCNDHVIEMDRLEQLKLRQAFKKEVSKKILF